VQLQVEASQEAKIVKWCVTTALRRDTKSGNAVNGKNKRVRKTRKLRSKIVIVTMMLAALLLQLMR